MPEQPTEPKPEPELTEDIDTADWEEAALDAAWERLFPGSVNGEIPEPQKPKEEGVRGNALDPAAQPSKIIRVLPGTQLDAKTAAPGAACLAFPVAREANRMKLSRAACDAIHAMVYIAQSGNGRMIVGHVAAKELGIPERFFLRTLGAVRGQLLRSLKGPSGGYSLARPAKKITLLDVIEAVDGPIVGQCDATTAPPDAVDRGLDAAAIAAAKIARKEFGRVTIAELAATEKKGR